MIVGFLEECSSGDPCVYAGAAGAGVLGAFEGAQGIAAAAADDADVLCVVVAAGVFAVGLFCCGCSCLPLAVFPRCLCACVLVVVFPLWCCYFIVACPCHCLLF